MKKALKGWTLFVVALSLLGLAACVHEEKQNASILASELEVAYEEIQNRGTIIATQEAGLLEISGVLQETVSRLSLLTTFADAGFPLDAGDVRDLLDLAKTLPYGSPFPDGHRITSEFGLRSITRYGWVDQEHLGIDLIPLNGDPTIIAPVDGYITDHGYSEIFGNYIEMQTVTGYRLFMGHLSRVYWPHADKEGNWSIDPDQLVKKGTRIANVGQTGAWATGLHLHYEIWIQVEGNWVPLDPEEIINFTGGEE